jgi:hypothetical protein
MLKRKNLFLGKWQIPILSGPLLEVNCFYAPCPPSPPHPLPTKRTFIYTQTTLTCLLLQSGTIFMKFHLLFMDFLLQRQHFLVFLLHRSFILHSCKFKFDALNQIPFKMFQQNCDHPSRYIYSLHQIYIHTYKVGL